jgi:DNA-binding beta-propeller fold protein YncE
MSGPNTVSASGRNLIITGYFSNVLQVLDADSGAVSQDVRDLRTPTNAIVHGDGIVVAEAGSATGTGPGDVVSLDDRSVLIDGLQLPIGLASDGTTLYVADWRTGDIWSAGPSGKTHVAAGLNQPEGLAITADGTTLLVVEEGIDQVTAIDLATGDRRAAAHLALGDRYPPGLQPYGQFTGIAVTSGGTFWVSSDVDNVLYHYPIPG